MLHCNKWHLPQHLWPGLGHDKRFKPRTQLGIVHLGITVERITLLVLVLRVSATLPLATTLALTSSVLSSSSLNISSSSDW